MTEQEFNEWLDRRLSRTVVGVIIRIGVIVALYAIVFWAIMWWTNGRGL